MTNKTTEALKLAEEALEDAYRRDEHAAARWVYEQALAAIREALAEPVCEHRIADARNEFVKDGYICIKCGALFRAADHAEPVKQEPVAILKSSKANFERHMALLNDVFELGVSAGINEAKEAISRAYRQVDIN